MKRMAAGSYTQIIDGLEYYAVKLENGWWSVGIQSSSGSSHIDDFRTYKQSRAYILRQAAKVGA